MGGITGDHEAALVLAARVSHQIGSQGSQSHIMLLCRWVWETPCAVSPQSSHVIVLSGSSSALWCSSLQEGTAQRGAHTPPSRLPQGLGASHFPHRLAKDGRNP